MPPTVVDRLHENFAGLLTVLDKAGRGFVAACRGREFRESLLLAAASYFERRMTETVLSFVEEATNRNVLVAAAVCANKAVSRQ